jgi:hypothetical protein
MITVLRGPSLGAGKGAAGVVSRRGCAVGRRLPRRCGIDGADEFGGMITAHEGLSQAWSRAASGPGIRWVPCRSSVPLAGQQDFPRRGLVRVCCVGERAGPVCLVAELVPGLVAGMSSLNAHVCLRCGWFGTELDQPRADTTGERDELRAALESRAQVLDKSHGEPLARAGLAERDLDAARARARQQTGTAQARCRSGAAAVKRRNSTKTGTPAQARISRPGVSRACCKGVCGAFPPASLEVPRSNAQLGQVTE